MIRSVKSSDAAAVAAIYNDYVLNTTITFETESVSVCEMERRIADFSSNFPYFVFEEDGVVLGYAYAHLWKARAAYARTWEATIYVKADCRRQGVGSRLLSALIEACRRQNAHVLIACITEGNQPSVALHEKFGFRQVSAFSQVGYKFNRWLGVADFELVL